MQIVLIVISLWVLYLALTGNLETANLIVGLVIAAGVTGLIRPRWGQITLRHLPAAVWAAVRYIVVLMWDLLKSGWQVAMLVINPNLQVKQGIIAIPSDTESLTSTALSAHAITLTPGEMVLEIDENGVMYTHCLDATESEQVVAQAQRMRSELLKKIVA